MVESPVPWYLSPSFLPAAFGLVGVVVGGLITALSSYYVERFRAKRESTREEHKRQVELRQAARMINEEFLEATAIGERMANTGRPTITELPTMRLFDQYLPILACELPDGAWNAVAFAGSGVSVLNRIRALGGGEGRSGFEPGMVKTIMRSSWIYWKHV